MPDNSPARCGYDNMQGMFNLIPPVPFIGLGSYIVYMFACVSTSLGHANTYCTFVSKQGRDMVGTVCRYSRHEMEP